MDNNSQTPPITPPSTPLVAERSFWWWFRLLFTRHWHYKTEKTRREKTIWIFGGFFILCLFFFNLFILFIAIAAMQSFGHYEYTQKQEIYKGQKKPTMPTVVKHEDKTIAVLTFSLLERIKGQGRGVSDGSTDKPENKEVDEQLKNSTLKMVEKKYYDTMIKWHQDNFKKQKNAFFVSHTFDQWPPIYQKAWIEVYGKKPLSLNEKEFHQFSLKNPELDIYNIQYMRLKDEQKLWVERNGLHTLKHYSKFLRFDFDDTKKIGAGSDLNQNFVSLFLNDLNNYKINAYQQYIKFQHQTKIDELKKNQPIILPTLLYVDDNDQRNIALVIFLIMGSMFGLVVWLPAVQWDVLRSSGALEPYAMMSCPSWFVVAAAFTDKFKPLGTLLISMGCVTYFVAVGLTFDWKFFMAIVMQIILLLGAWCFSTTASLFVICSFQSWLGRMLGRLLILPILGICFIFYRGYWVFLLNKVVEGAAFEEINWGFGLIVGLVFLIASIFVVTLTSKRIGKYRMGFVKIKPM